MAKVICSDLGGPEECTIEITGQTAEEMAKNCQEHVMDEIHKGDEAHQEAVENMQNISPEEQKEKFTQYMEFCRSSFKR